MPCRVWLSWLKCHPIPEGLWVQFTVTAHTWFDPQSGHVQSLVQEHTWSVRIGGSCSMLLSHIDVSLSLPLSKRNENKCPWVRIKNKFITMPFFGEGRKREGKK